MRDPYLFIVAWKESGQTVKEDPYSFRKANSTIFRNTRCQESAVCPCPNLDLDLSHWITSKQVTERKGKGLVIHDFLKSCLTFMYTCKFFCWNGRHASRSIRVSRDFSHFLLCLIFSGSGSLNSIQEKSFYSPVVPDDITHLVVLSQLYSQCKFKFCFADYSKQ